MVRRSLVTALVIGLTGVAIFVLGPTGELPVRVVRKTSSVLADLGLPAWVVDWSVWEGVYNIALFVPVAFAGALLWRKVPVTVWVAVGFLASLAIESVQAVFLSGRSPQLKDLVTNTAGALVGALLARLAGRVLDAHAWRRTRDTYG
jgi:hypothetical protein